MLPSCGAVSIELFHDEPGDKSIPGTTICWARSKPARQATERLAAAMRTTAMPALRRRHSWAWLLLPLVCLLFGAGASSALRPRPLITAAADDPTAIPEHDTAQSQYLYAILLGNEAGLKSVPHYFGEANVYSRLAKEQLALLYLREYDYARAMEIFDEFATYNDVEVQFRAFGVAGQAVVLYRQDRFSESADKLAQLYPLRKSLDGEMRVLVESILQRSKLPGDRRTLDEWRRWFRTAPPPANPIDPTVAAPPAG